MRVSMERESELDFVRVVSMFMIVFCHISAEAAMKWGEYFNAGVMIFLFMSGLLSRKSEYDKKWVFGRLKRILPEYYIFLTVYLFIAMTFLHADISIRQIVINTFLLQGFFTESGVPNILHLWFVSYILTCYLLTPVLQRFLKGARWKDLLFAALVLQAAVLPLRLLGIRIVFSRFAAYFLGLYLAMHQKAGDKSFRYKKLSKKLAIPVLLINGIRFAFELSGKQDHLPRIADMALGLVWQWAHMFLGVLLFYVLWCVGHALIRKQSAGLKNVIASISSLSYCVYVVHQVFVYHEYAITRYLSPYPIGLMAALLCIVISAFALYNLSNWFRKLLRANKNQTVQPQ